MDTTVEVGEAIRRTRLELGWSQDELAWKTHIAQRLISRYETGLGKPDFERLSRIAKTFAGEGRLEWEFEWLKERAVGDDSTDPSGDIPWSTHPAPDQRFPFLAGAVG